MVFLPVSLRAESVDIIYDDNGIDASIEVRELTTVAPAFPVPVVQFDAPGPGVYALDRVAFFLRQGAELLASPVPGVMLEAAPDPATSTTYPVTVQVWDLVPGTTADYVPGAAMNADFTVGEKGWYLLDLTDEATDPKLIFTGSVRIGLYLRPLLPLPAVLPPPLNLGIDNDGSDGTAPAPYGHSWLYDPAAVAPATPWSQDMAANYGIRAAVHAVPTLACEGFLPPLHKPVTMKRGGRTLPLKARLLDADGNPVLAKNLQGRPVVELLLGETELTDAVVPAGKSNLGQAFRNAGKGRWIYNFKTGKNLAPGTYELRVETPDITKFLIEPTCVGKFTIEAPVVKKAPPAKGKK